MIDLETLERDIRKGRCDEVAAAFDGTTEAERKEALPLVTRLRRMRDSFEAEGTFRHYLALEVALQATAPSAEAAYREAPPVWWMGITHEDKWARRRTAASRLSRAALVQRDVRWHLKLVELLTAVDRPNDFESSIVDWEWVDALLARAGVSRIDTPDFAVRALARASVTLGPDAGADDVLATLPDAPAMILASLGSTRADWNQVPAYVTNVEPDRSFWPRIAAALVDRGLLDRDTLHAALLDALAADGMRPHVSMLRGYWAALAPSPAEVRGHLRRYLALVDSRMAGTATDALAALRAADADSPLDVATIVDAATRAIGRTDTGPGTAALAWLRAVLKRDPASADEVARAAASGFVHPKRTLQDKAHALAEEARAVAPLREDTVEEIDAMAGALSPLISGVSAAPALPERPPVPQRPPMLPRVTDTQGFFELVATFDSEADTYLKGEALLDAFSAVVPGNEDEIRARLERRDKLEWLPWPETGQALVGLLKRPGGGVARTAWDLKHRNPSGPDTRSATGPRAGLIHRIHEVFHSAKAGPRPLLALPTDGAGFIAPDALLARLRAGAASVGPIDREQAWLRLPVAAYDGELERDLRTLGGEDASWLADRLAAGPLAPPTFTRTPSSDGRVTHAVAWPEAGGSTILTAMLRPTKGWEAAWGVEAAALTTPGQRDFLARFLQSSGPFGEESVAALAHAEGPAGEPTEVAVARAATSDRPRSRTDAVDVILANLAHDVASPTVAAAAWAPLLDDPETKLGRWHGVLQQVAASSVAGSRYVWAVLAELLSGRFEELSGRHGFGDVVALAGETALTVGATGSLPGLDALADRSGRSRAVVEARRLRTVLAGGTP